MDSVQVNAAVAAVVVVAVVPASGIRTTLMDSVQIYAAVAAAAAVVVAAAVAAYGIRTTLVDSV